jgi:hypothetical protein
MSCAQTRASIQVSLFREAKPVTPPRGKLLLEFSGQVSDGNTYLNWLAASRWARPNPHVPKGRRIVFLEVIG